MGAPGGVSDTLPQNDLPNCSYAIPGLGVAWAFCRDAGGPKRVEPHHAVGELRALIRAEPNARVVRRLQAVLAAREGRRPRHPIPADRPEAGRLPKSPCPDRRLPEGRAEGLITDRLNTAVVQLFLDPFAATIPAVALIGDNAGYHVAKALRVPAAIALVPLPPYSPELNPVESLWHDLRSHHGSNRFITSRCRNG